MQDQETRTEIPGTTEKLSLIVSSRLSRRFGDGNEASLTVLLDQCFSGGSEGVELFPGLRFTRDDLTKLQEIAHPFEEAKEQLRLRNAEIDKKIDGEIASGALVLATPDQANIERNRAFFTELVSGLRRRDFPVRTDIDFESKAVSSYVGEGNDEDRWPEIGEFALAKRLWEKGVDLAQLRVDQFKVFFSQVVGNDRRFRFDKSRDISDQVVDVGSKVEDFIYTKIDTSCLELGREAIALANIGDDPTEKISNFVNLGVRALSWVSESSFFDKPANFQEHLRKTYLEVVDYKRKTHEDLEKRSADFGVQASLEQMTKISDVLTENADGVMSVLDFYEGNETEGVEDIFVKIQGLTAKEVWNRYHANSVKVEECISGLKGRGVIGVSEIDQLARLSAEGLIPREYLGLREKDEEVVIFDNRKKSGILGLPGEFVYRETGELVERINDLLKRRSDQKLNRIGFYIELSSIFVDFIKIHPLMDGNGRVGVYLVEAVSVMAGEEPSNFFVREGETYEDRLRKAFKGFPCELAMGKYFIESTILIKSNKKYKNKEESAVAA